MFFIIAYFITIVTCIICNLAVNHALSWFWIVFSALMLGSSLATFPRYIKKYKLLILSISPLLCLILFLGVCCIYTSGNWFWVAIFPIILSFVIVFLPIYIKVYNVPKFIKKQIAIQNKTNIKKKTLLFEGDTSCITL